MTLFIDIVKSSVSSCELDAIATTASWTSTPVTTTEDWDLISKEWNKNAHSTRKRSTTDDPASSEKDEKSLFWTKADDIEKDREGANEDFDVTIASKLNKLLKKESVEKKLKTFSQGEKDPKIGKKERFKKFPDIVRGKAWEGFDYFTVDMGTTERSRESRSTKEDEADMGWSSSQKAPESTKFVDSAWTSLEPSTSTSSPDAVISSPSNGLEALTKSPLKDAEDIVERKKSTGIKKGDGDGEKASKLDEDEVESVSVKISAKNNEISRKAAGQEQNTIDEINQGN